MEIPAARKAVDGSFATSKKTMMGILAIEVHPVGFTFVPKQASIGRKLKILASTGFTLVWFQMGIQIFATSVSCASWRSASDRLTRNRISASWVGEHIGFL